MSNPPPVSVVTVVYNGEQLLGQAIASILSQSHSDFEYVIVDDASQDNTYAVASSYAAQDDRILLLRNGTNLGISGALNRGVAAAQGELVVMLDHDDRAHPERLAQQRALLAAHPEFGAVGCHMAIVDLDGACIGMYRPPVEPLRLRWEMLFRCAIPSGAACYRRALLTGNGGFSPAFAISGDFELLTRLGVVTELSVVPEVLLSYRSHPAQTTRTKADRTHWEAMLAAAHWWRNWLGLNASLGDVGLVYRGVNGGRLASPAEAARAAALVEELHRRCLAQAAPDSAGRDYLAANVARKLAALQAAAG